MLRMLAIICVRNEAIHLRRCLRAYIEDGIDVVLIDNGSTDGSLEIAQEFLGHGLIAIEHLDWSGAFSLSDQLRAKQTIASNADHDWIIHADADEWLCTDRKDQSLREGIVEADAQGYTVINFHEIVFVPLRGENFFFEIYASRMRSYYFFQPSYPRLNRAWSNRLTLDNTESGGHVLKGDGMRLFNRDFILRHYIALSEEHASRKYVGRNFSDEDIAIGWHGNRRTICAENLSVKPVLGLMQLADPNECSFDLRFPLKTHFWEW